MTAYSFKARFAEPILAGTKGGTIRATRKWRYGSGRHADLGGHAFPGEELQLYTGMRTKQCRLVARKICVATEPLTLDFVASSIWLGLDARLVYLARDLDTFAVFDGFHCWEELIEFWAKTHDAHKFRGWHIRWMELPQMGWTRG